MASWVAVSLARSFTDRKRKAYRTVWKWKGGSYQRPLPQLVNINEPGLEAASDEGVWRLKNLAVRIWAGYSESEVAKTHGETPAWVRTELGTLRDELRRVGQ
jgi:hypothetical protein